MEQGEEERPEQKGFWSNFFEICLWKRFSSFNQLHANDE